MVILGKLLRGFLSIVCVIACDRSYESDEGDDMVDCYGDGVGFDDDDFDY